MKPFDNPRARWLTLAAAFLGWMFDGFEMGLFPLIGRPAIADLLGPGASPDDAGKWFGVIIAVFLVGAASGGVLFGWLGDRVGRVRAMSLSILTYALFTGFCGFASEAWQVAVLRFVASLGMGGEWSLGVALVNEVWPGKSRALIAGLIGAAANVGFLLVGVLSLALTSFIGGVETAMLAVGVPQAEADRLLANSAWRFLMISGAIPALLVFFIRMMVPESEKWQHEHRRGATAHWANADLWGVLGGAAASLAVIWAWSPDGAAFLSGALSPALSLPATLLLTAAGLASALAGFLYPVRRYLSRAEEAGSLTGSGRQVLAMMLFGAGLAGVALLGTWGSIQWAPRWAGELPLDPRQTPLQFHPHGKEWTQIWLALGAIVVTIIAPLCAGRFGRRITYCVLCGASIASALFLYQANDRFGPLFLFSVFLAGGITASFYGFFPLYLPELFPTAVRAVGQGFAFNFGRILAAVGGLQTATLMGMFNGSFPMAGSVLTAIYLVGALIIWFGPETKGQPLPE